MAQCAVHNFTSSSADGDRLASCPRLSGRQSSLRGFSLIELLVVVAIVALLVSLMLPVLAKARSRAASLKCQSNLRQNYAFLLMYCNDNKGYMFPYDWGTAVPRRLRWPVYVFKPPVWNPPTLKCSADPEGAEEHSYVLNTHLILRDIRFGRTGPGGPSSSNVILMGEKKPTEADYYLQIGDFDRVVEQYRHGLTHGSNYLFLDGHVGSQTPTEARRALDPWDPGGT